MLALDQHVAGARYFGFKHRVLSQAAHQHAGAPVDETLGKPLVQRVGQVVLYLTCEPLPMFGIGKPVRAVRYIGPSPYLRDARARISMSPSLRSSMRELAGEPVVGNATGPHNVTDRL